MTARLLPFLLIFILHFSANAREGMWLPMLLDRNLEEMQEMGFQLTSEDMYSVNHASLKDAIVLFGSGCTGEVISPDGLLITNHHCGYSSIQKHSSMEHDYLTNGFWAMNRNEELPNEGLAVSFLVEMKEVTNEILAGTDSLITDTAREEKIRENSAIMVDEAVDGTHYKASIKSFFSQNQYFLIITEKFTDVRLVGAPPSSIGNFGGDTDNWMWPRHTGDFSMFRIYADSSNRPSDYSPNNIPYHPKTFLPINTSGFQEGDFTMVYGFPASTQQNLYSEAVKQIIDQRDPDRIAIRDIKMEIMNRAMNADAATRIKYASKEKSVGNAWKKWQGEMKGLQRINAVELKIDREKTFTDWVNAEETRKYKYGQLLSNYDQLYNELAPFQKVKDYYDEIILRGTDVYSVYRHFNAFQNNNEKLDKQIEEKFLQKHFKDYDTNVDETLFIGLLDKYHKDLDQKFVPLSLSKHYTKRDPHSTLRKIYANSILTNQDKLNQLIKTKSRAQVINKIKKDQLYRLFEAFNESYYAEIIPEYNRISKILKQLQTDYVAALMDMNQQQLLFPDANQTLRVSYGKVEGYVPADGIEYKYYTTIDGIIEKDNPEIYDYDVPDRLKELYAQKDFGSYANASGQVPVCFTASNHTTGGNSGSPVLDKNGYLIGINFDRCWEGTMSDVMFDPEKCRNISLDMRYMLFIIDKFAGASYLLDEMKLVK
ncbi:MAG: S46 family peptidase [Prolixibacteraceae bacterium]